MALLTELGLALIVASVFSAILVAIVGWDGYAAGGWPTAVVLFGVLFLMTWVGGLWLSPIGPQLWGAEWIPFVATGFVMALLLAALLPLHGPRSRHLAADQADAKEVVRTTMSVFFWVLLAVLAVAVGLHYADIVAERSVVPLRRKSRRARTIRDIRKHCDGCS